MIRILLFTLAVVAAAAGLAWLADRPGTINIEWLGYQIETSAFVGTLAVGLLVVLLIALWALLRYRVHATRGHRGACARAAAATRL